MIPPILFGSIAELLFKHSDLLFPAGDKLASFLSHTSMAGGIDQALRVVGSTLQATIGGNSRILGMLEKVTFSQSQLNTAMGALSMQNAHILTGLTALKSLSMISLGFTGIGAAAVVAQFINQRQRFDQLQKEIKKLQKQVNMLKESDLHAGVIALQLAEQTRKDGRLDLDRFTSAIDQVRPAGIYFQQLANDENVHGNNLEVVRYCARNYFVAFQTELSALISLDQLENAKLRLKNERPNLLKIAQWAYGKTVEDNVAAFLSPNFKEIVTLQLMSEVLQQAKYLECPVEPAALSPTDIFEHYRWALIKGRLFSMNRKTVVTSLNFARSIFAETQALLSWSDVIDQFQRAGTTATNVRSGIEAERKKAKGGAADEQYLFYALA